MEIPCCHDDCNAESEYVVFPHTNDPDEEVFGASVCGNHLQELTIVLSQVWTAMIVEPRST